MVKTVTLGDFDEVRYFYLGFPFYIDWLKNVVVCMEARTEPMWG